jgi:hypothetical protein
LSFHFGGDRRKKSEVFPFLQEKKYYVRLEFSLRGQGTDAMQTKTQMALSALDTKKTSQIQPFRHS